MEFKKKATVLAMLALGFEGTEALADSPLTQQLKEQAQFWAQRGKDENAADAWRKLLKIDPANAEALTALALHEANAGNNDMARSYYSRLRGSNASSTQIKSVEAALKRGGSANANSQIEEARKLARQGDNEAAAEAFKRVTDTSRLKGEAALEYYQVLAGSKQGYAEAKKGLEKLSKENSSNQKYALAYAQVLTYREAHRAEGLQLLEKLTAKTEVSSQALESWRQALSWMPVKSENTKYFRRFSEKYPEDKVIAERLAQSTLPANNREELSQQKVVTVQADASKLAESKSTEQSKRDDKKAESAKLVKTEKIAKLEKTAKVSKAEAADDDLAKENKETKAKRENSADKYKMAGFKALEENDVAAAQTEFTALLKAYPKDPAAYGGMGLIKMRQEEFKEARNYLQKAVELSPAHAKDQWREAYDGASYWALIDEARNDFEEGESVKGIATLKKAIALNDKEPSAILQLADALQAENDLAGAEENFRRVFAADNKNLRALDGIIGVLTLQKRIADLEALAPHMLPRHLAIVANLKSTDLYDKAKVAEQAGDIPKAQALLEDAILIKPENAWLRMALAKIYLKRKMPDQARALIDAMTQVQNPDPEALYVSALLSEMQQQWWDALLTLERIPAAARKNEMYTMQKRIWIRVQLDRIDVYTQQGNLPRAREVLAAVETTAGNDPEFLGTLANLYIKFGDVERGSAMIKQAVQNTANPPAGLLLQYASTLMRNNQEAELEAVMRKVAAMPKLDDAEIVAFQQLQKVLSLRYSERAREAGDFAGAYNYLQALLIAEPEDSMLLLALARIYNSAGDQDAARELYGKVLNAEPDNPEVLQGIVYASMQMKDLATAEKHLSTLLKIQPENPRYLSLAGNIARAQGNNSRALSYFKQALALEQAQSAVIGGGANGLRLVNNSTPGVTDFRTNPFAERQLASNPGTSTNSANYAARPPALREVQTNVAAAPVLPANSASNTSANSAKLEKSGIFAPVGVPLQTPSPASPNLPSIPQLPAKAGDKPSSQAYPVANGTRAELPATVTSYQNASANAVNLTYLSGAGGNNRGAAGGSGEVPQLAQANNSYRNEVQLKRGNSASSANRSYVSPEEAALLKEIDAINEMRRTQLTADISVRARSGEKGMSQLKDIETPIEAQINTLGLGQFGLKIIPVMLDAGSLGVNDTNVAGQFGKNAILVERAKFAKLPVTTILKQRGLPANSEIAQEAHGVALNMSYELAGVKVDLGTSPSGFPVRNILGGIRWAGDIEGIQLGIEATRRSVTDSLLSYAGTSDNLFGQTWGGVTKTGVKFDTSYDFDEGGLYASAGYYVLNGKNVARNTMFELGGGAYWRAYKSNDVTLTTGLGLTSFFYNRNLRYFTYGHGGYFSPKSYLALGIPLEVAGRKGKLSYQLAGSIGVQHFREVAAPYYPITPQDQTDLDLFAAANPTVNVQTFYPGQSRTGISFKLSAGLEYLLNPHISLGGRFSADNSGDFNDASASLYLRYTFEPRKTPVSYPPVAPKPNYSGN